MPLALSPQQADERSRILSLIADAIVEVVQAAEPHGAPGGVLYAALMPFGCTLHQFETIMRVLISIGRLRKAGELYFVPEKEEK